MSFTNGDLVRHETGDIGVVTDCPDRFQHVPYDPPVLWVKWETGTDAGSVLHVGLHECTHVEYADHRLNTMVDALCMIKQTLMGRGNDQDKCLIDFVQETLNNI